MSEKLVISNFISIYYNNERSQINNFKYLSKLNFSYLRDHLLKILQGFYFDKIKGQSKKN